MKHILDDEEYNQLVEDSRLYNDVKARCFDIYGKVKLESQNAVKEELDGLRDEVLKLRDDNGRLMDDNYKPRCELRAFRSDGFLGALSRLFGFNIR